MRFQLKYQAQDYIEGYKAYAARSSRRWFVWYLWIIAIVLLVIGFFGSIGPGASFASAFPALLMGALGIYYALTIWNRAGRRSFSGRPELTQEFVIDLDEGGVALNGPMSQAHWTWQAFVKSAEAEKLFLLYLSPCAFVILPKRVLGPGQAEQLRDILQQKLPPK